MLLHIVKTFVKCIAINFSKSVKIVKLQTLVNTDIPIITHHTPPNIDSIVVSLFTGTWCRVIRIKSVHDVTGIRLVRDVTGVQP